MGKYKFILLQSAVLISAVPFIIDANHSSVIAEQVQASQEVINIQNYFAKVAEQLKPTVVNISTIYVEKYSTPQYEFYFGAPFEDFFNEFFGETRPRRGPQGQPRERNLQRKYEGTGTGVIIDSDGYILTNEHVVRGADEINVTLYDDKKYTGKVVGKDAKTDLAIIKIMPGKRLPFAKLGNSESIRVGDWAIAIGSPFGLQETVTSGIISAVRQSLPIEGREYKDLIQTDAAINRGNSGGPLCNIQGEIIGINTAIYAPTGVFSGIGFAIPINNAKEILNDLMSKGKVVRGWLGVEIRPVDDAVARTFGIPDKKGVLVNEVLDDSPAKKSGLKRGDIIREFAGKKIDDGRALQATVAQTEPDKRVDVKIIRDGSEMKLSLVTGEMPAEEDTASSPKKDKSLPENKNMVDWEGLKAVTLNDTIARQYEIPADEKGCVVLSVEPGSTGSEMGVLPGDLVRFINRSATPTIDEFREVVKKIKLSEGIILDISRRGRLIYLSYMAE